MVPGHRALIPVQHIADAVESLLLFLLFAAFFDHPCEVLLCNVCCLCCRLRELEVALVGLRLAELMLLLGETLNDYVIGLDHPICALFPPVVLVFEHLFVVDLCCFVHSSLLGYPALCPRSLCLIAWLQGCSMWTEALLFLSSVYCN